MKLCYALVLMMMLMMCIVSAQDLVYTNDTVQRYASIVYANTFYPVQNVTVTLFQNNTQLITQGQCTQQLSGVWYYNYTPNITGLYYEYYYFYNTTGGLIATGDDTFTVVDNIPNKTSEVLQMIFSTFIIFLVGIALLVVGYYIKNIYLALISGVWFIINTFVLSFEGQGWSFPLFFALVGSLIMWYAIDIIIREWGKEIKTEYNSAE